MRDVDTFVKGGLVALELRFLLRFFFLDVLGFFLVKVLFSFSCWNEAFSVEELVVCIMSCLVRSE